MIELVNGVVLINKPRGITSFQALGKIKRTLQTKKVGHTGTLDKFADGLLVVLTGKLTKLNALITGMDKEYEALVCFGRETDTLDPEGEVVRKAPVPDLEKIESVLDGFLGEQQQVPPVYSAIHINGKRAYQMARQGESVQMASRSVRIDGLKILHWEAPYLRLRVRCSKGTYIRALARDIASAAGSAAYLTELRRTGVGPFRLADAFTAEEFQPENLVRPFRLFRDYPLGIQSLMVPDSVKDRIKQGKTLSAGDFIQRPETVGEYAVFSKKTECLLAMVRFDGSEFKYNFVV